MSVYFWPISDSIPTTRRQRSYYITYEYTDPAPLLFTGLPDYLCLIILNDQRDARIHVHPLCKNQGRKNGASFVLAPGILKKSVGNQGSLNITKRFLKQPCGLEGERSVLYLSSWLKACCGLKEHTLLIL